MPNKLGGYQYLKSISIDEPPTWELVQGKSNIRETIHSFQKQFIIYNDEYAYQQFFLMEIRLRFTEEGCKERL